MSKYVFIVLTALLLTGCQSKNELENRDYVMAIGIDKDNGYDVTAAVAKLAGSKDSPNTEENIYTGKGNSISDAMADINNKTKGELFLGHNKVFVLSNDFDNYEELINYFSKNIDISRDTIIVSANEPKKILEGKNNDDSASEYIYSYFEDKNKFDLDRLMDYYSRNKQIELPDVKIENENIVIG